MLSGVTFLVVGLIPVSVTRYSRNSMELFFNFSGFVMIPYSNASYVVSDFLTLLRNRPFM